MNREADPSERWMMFTVAQRTGDDRTYWANCTVSLSSLEDAVPSPYPVLLEQLVGRVVEQSGTPEGEWLGLYSEQAWLGLLGVGLPTDSGSV